MFEKILEQLKHPVTVTLQKSESEDLKKGMIKLAILSAIMSLVNIITIISGIFSMYSKSWYSSYSSSELWDMKWDAIKDAELFGTFFKTWVILAVAIAAGALVLFIIAKLIKNQKEYASTLSMVNSSMSIYVVGMIINTVFSFIYAPIGVLVLCASVIYASFTLMNAFRDSLNVENTDGLVLVSTGVLIALIVILVVVISSVIGVSLSELTSITSLLDF